MIQFNNDIKLIFADVDDTIAPPYIEATADMIHELNRLLSEDRSLILTSGGSLQSIMQRITDKTDASLRHKILIVHCLGAETWGFEKDGKLMPHAWHSVYHEKLDDSQKMLWRKLVEEVEEEFGLRVYPTQPMNDFVKESNGDPKAVMKADRGPQITWEFVNDPGMRDPIIAHIQKVFTENHLPVTPRKGGTCALDLALEGVSKTSAMKHILDNGEILQSIDMHAMDILRSPNKMEIWGDRFMPGLPDVDMSLALPPRVRSISFRKEEDVSTFPQGYNIVLWDGAESLCEGLLEYLRTSTTSK